MTLTLSYLIAVDITKQCCGKCRGKLEPLFLERTSAYSGEPADFGRRLLRLIVAIPIEYTKINYRLAQASIPNPNFTEVMKALSERWMLSKTAGIEMDQESHAAWWRSVALDSFGLLVI